VLVGPGYRAGDVVKVDVDGGQLAAAVLAEAQRLEPQSPERRAAAALYVALTDTGTIAAARRALTGFAAPETAAAALELLGRLVREAAQ
jgi:hypothetical protein